MSTGGGDSLSDSARQVFCEDTEELEWHIETLRLRRRQLPPPAREGPHAAAAAWLDGELAALQSALASPSPGSSLLAQEDRLRSLHKLLAWLETSPSWHSPGLDVEPGLHDLSPLTIIPGFNDYERGLVSRGRSFERWLETDFFAGVPDHKRCLLFSSGMGAIQTALQQAGGRGRSLLLGRRVYYETRELLARAHGGSFGEIIALDEANADPGYLEDRVAAADAVVVDTVSLDPEAVRVDVARLFAAVRPGRQVAIILDNTVPGPMFTPPPPPADVLLFQVESLLKFYQGGLDLGAAGLLLLRSQAPQPRLHEDLEALRSTNGTNINPYSVRLLPGMPRRFVERRLRRHSRNAGILARHLERDIPVYEVGNGGLMFLGTESPDAVLAIAQLLALATGHRVAQGTSFGFNRLRLCRPPKTQKLLRLAAGMETVAELMTAATLIATAVQVSGNDAVRTTLPSFKAQFPAFPDCTCPDEKARHAFLSDLDRFLALVAETASGLPDRG